MPGDGDMAAAHEGAVADGRHLYRVAALGAAALLTAYLLWLLLDVGNPSARHGVAHSAAVVLPLVAAGACWRAHRLRAGRHAAWAWLAS